MALLGYRMMNCDPDGTLVGATGKRWAAVDLAAICKARLHHDPPALTCGCGIYALHRPRTAWLVTVAVLGWGRMELCRDGWRAARARIVAVSADRLDGDTQLQIANRYGVPLVSRSNLPVVAREFGDPYVPEEALAAARAITGALRWCIPHFCTGCGARTASHRRRCEECVFANRFMNLNRIPPEYYQWARDQVQRRVGR